MGTAILRRTVRQEPQHSDPDTGLSDLVQIWFKTGLSDLVPLVEARRIEASAEARRIGSQAEPRRIWIVG